MSKHLNPLEKEFLIRTYRSSQTVKMKDFCEKNNVSVGAFQKRRKQAHSEDVSTSEKENE